MAEGTEPHAVALRLAGIGWFLFIPLVLYLFLAYPFGIFASVIPGLVIMVVHRRLAESFMRRHLHHRCFWCARVAGRHAQLRASEDGSGSTSLDRRGGEGEGVPLPLPTGKETIEFWACSDHCGDSARRFASFMGRFRLPIAFGIFVPLVVYLAGILMVGVGVGFLPEWAEEGLHHLFRGVIAVTVVKIALFYRFFPAREPLPAFRFPIHNISLLGGRYTLVVFSVVGTVWIVQTVRALVVWYGL